MPNELRIVGSETREVLATLQIPDGLDARTRAGILIAQGQVVRQLLDASGSTEQFRYKLPGQIVNEGAEDFLL